MKKIAMLLMLLMLPMMVMAKDEVISVSDYKTTGLEETLKLDGIDITYESYTENDKQVPIYLFWGNGCGVCKNFLTFLDSITDEYGKYFKLVAFEVWYDANNSNLMTTVSNYLGQPAGGVPYIVIGDQVFGGFSESSEESIKSAIKDLYDSKEKYDVFEDMNNVPKEVTNTHVIIWNLVFTLVSSATIVTVVCVNNHNLRKRIDLLERKMKGSKKNA